MTIPPGYNLVVKVMKEIKEERKLYKDTKIPAENVAMMKLPTNIHLDNEN